MIKEENTKILDTIKENISRIEREKRILEIDEKYTKIISCVRFSQSIESGKNDMERMRQDSEKLKSEHMSHVQQVFFSQETIDKLT